MVENFEQHGSVHDWSIDFQPSSTLSPHVRKFDGPMLGIVPAGVGSEEKQIIQSQVSAFCPPLVLVHRIIAVLGDLLVSGTEDSREDP